MEDYRNALKTGLKQYKKAVHDHEDPYPQVLSDVLKDTVTEGEKYIGTMEIPLYLIVGTKDAGRRNAFSREFYPLLDESSEFAYKWINLFWSQMDEGFRDPIKVYEYQNRFYVQEGNKRVSVGRYLNMPTILASVTRILPPKSETSAYRKYTEFLRFFDKTQMYQILFSRYGSYEKMLKYLGRTWEDTWSEDDIRRLEALYYHFSEGFLELNPDAEPETVGDGFLSYLELQLNKEPIEKNSSEIKEDILSMKPELKKESGDEEICRVLDPEDIKPALMDKIFPPVIRQIKAAFIYDGDSRTSDWNYAHELGRKYIEKRFKDKVVTTAYRTADNGRPLTEILEEAVQDGNTVIFTTSLNMMPAAVNFALKYPEVHFFNCSVNFTYKTVQTYYIRIYEAKFLTGLIAGVLSGTNDIRYEAGYPIFETVAQINAFALGVQMVNPNAKVRLYWSSVKEGSSPTEDDEGSIISAKNTITAGNGRKNYGLYAKNGDQITKYAVTVFRWGRFYEHILNLLSNGTLKNASQNGTKTMNYWWGISSGVIDTVCSNEVPDGLKKLVHEFRKLLARNEFHVFAGEIKDQNGKVHGKDGEVFTNEEIITMNWLCENVIGTIPVKEELTEKGAALAQMQGVQEEES